MATAASTRKQVQLCIGKLGLPVGSLVYVRQGQRQNSALAYDEAWLASSSRFNVSADLQLLPGHQAHKALSPEDSVFHGAVADTAPDAWGRHVIARDHAKRRKADPKLSALTEMDYLLAVDDFSRVGALRLRDPQGDWHREVAVGRRSWTTLRRPSNLGRWTLPQPCLVAHGLVENARAKTTPEQCHQTGVSVPVPTARVALPSAPVRAKVLLTPCPNPHWISSSTRSSSVLGIVIPSALAVFRLTTR